MAVHLVVTRIKLNANSAHKQLWLVLLAPTLLCAQVAFLATLLIQSTLYARLALHQYQAVVIVTLLQIVLSVLKVST